MTTPIACIRAKAEAGKVSKKLVQDLDQIIAEMDPSMSSTDQALRLKEIITHRLNKKKQQTALQIKVIDELEKQAELARNSSKRTIKAFGFDVSKMTLAMLSRLTYDPTGTFRGSNVEISWKAVKGVAESLFAEGLERFHRTHLGLKQDRVGLESFVRSLFGEGVKDGSIKTIAESFKRTDDYLVRRMQQAGGDIARRENWGLPQHHDSKRIGQATKEDWKQFILSRLDREKMIDFYTGQKFTDQALDRVLDDVYETLATDGMNKITPGGPRQGRKLANRHMDARFLIFRNADSWLEYNERFGTGGDIFELLTGHIDQMSREIAILENLGPNPDATVRWMQDTIRKETAEINKGKKFSSVRDKSGALAIEKLYDILSGRANAPGTAWWAEAQQFTRNILSSAQLGGAFVTATTDLNFQRLTGTFNGLDVVRQQGRFVRQFFDGLTGREQQRLAAKLQLGAEQWSGTAIGQQRFLGEVTGPRSSRLVADGVLRGTLLTPWTYAGRHSFKQEVLASIADRANVRWDRLEPEFRRGLERYAIDEADWNKIRQPSNFLDENGQRYFWADAATRNGNDAVARKVMNFVFTETEYAVPSSSTLTQLAVTGGTQSGTFYGEMIRNVGLYKSFPVTVLANHVMRGTAYSGVSKAGKMRYLLDMMISTTIFGGVVMQMKQIQNGKDPIEVLNLEHGPEFFMAAMLQGGGLGLFGDFLFADQNRFGYGPLNSLAGPVLGSFVPDTLKLTIGNLQELAYGEDTKAGRELVQYLKRYTPGASAWYGRLALERLLFDRMQELLDPDADASFRRRVQRADQDYGQQFWWTPGDDAPDRRPDIGAILQ